MKQKQAILFVHGHMGSPKQFVPLISLLRGAAGDIYSVTLPGHDGTAEEFARSNKSEWQGCVDGYIDELRTRYESLLLVGHSMGGLLLINSAAANPASIRAIIAIALPLYLRISAKSIGIRLSAIQKPKPNESPAVALAREMCGVSGIGIHNTLRLVPNTFGLFSLMRQCRGALSRLACELCIINSRGDELVSMRTVPYAMRKSGFVSTLTLDAASHFRYPQRELESIAQKIRALCKA